MQQNVGPRERWLRLAAGAAVAYVAVRALGPGRLAPAALLAAGVMMFETGVTRVCPVNALLGIGARPLEGGAGAPRLRSPGEQIGSAQRLPSDS